MAEISVLLSVFNEVVKILVYLESVKWTDEILIVYSYSIDETINIAQQYEGRIIQHEYINSAK